MLILNFDIYKKNEEVKIIILFNYLSEYDFKLKLYALILFLQVMKLLEFIVDRLDIIFILKQYVPSHNSLKN